MPIAIGTKGLRLTTGFREQDGGRLIPCKAGAALTRAGAVRSSGRDTNSGEILAVAAVGDAGREAYLGFQWQGARVAGAALSVVRGVIITGFTGLTVDKAVFVSDDGATDIGLTHTTPTTGANRARIGVAVSADSILLD